MRPMCARAMRLSEEEKMRPMCAKTARVMLTMQSSLRAEHCFRTGFEEYIRNVAIPEHEHVAEAECFLLAGSRFPVPRAGANSKVDARQKRPRPRDRVGRSVGPRAVQTAQDSRYEPLYCADATPTSKISHENRFEINIFSIKIAKKCLRRAVDEILRDCRHRSLPVAIGICPLSLCTHRAAGGAKRFCSHIRVNNRFEAV